MIIYLVKQNDMTLSAWLDGGRAKYECNAAQRKYDGDRAAGRIQFFCRFWIEEVKVTE